MFSLRYQGREIQSENRKLTQYSMNARKNIFFVPYSAKISLLKIIYKTGGAL